jgi:hypothetical protein
VQGTNEALSKVARVLPEEIAKVVEMHIKCLHRGDSRSRAQRLIDEVLALPEEE